jgi:carbon-monoxide dehydrogenase large subunit
MSSAKGLGRLEDSRLLRGNGRYSADRSLPDQVYAAFLRSPFAHANLRAVSVSAAQSMEGVLAVLTSTDIAAVGYGNAPCVPGLKHADGTTMVVPDWVPLAYQCVRFAGEPVAIVVATNPFIAVDATEAIECDYNELPPIIATKYDAAPPIAIWPHAPDTTWR